MTAQVSMGRTHRDDDVLRRFLSAGMMDRIDGGGVQQQHGGEGPQQQATIHSGHFMVSCVHEDLDDATVKEGDDQENDQGNDETLRSGSGGDDDEEGGYNFENANRMLSDSYQFGARNTNQLSIDASLAKLFEHMTLAYSGKITSPKWKNFKGIKVKLKDKIRLNNIIWREWHMQYIKRQEPIVCQFEAPISERTHAKPEAVVLEGKYWKRRLQCLTTEYKKWRLFFKNRFSKVQKATRPMEEEDLCSLRGNYERLATQFAPNKLFDEQMMMIEDDYLSTFANDTLFSSLNQPFAFPDTREISQLGFGDIIQPNLIQLQPSLDESMDTLAPLPVLNVFRDFSRYPSERIGSHKLVDEGLIDIILNEAQFSYQTSHQEAPTTTLDLQSTTSPTDEYLINQLQQQLMQSPTLSHGSCLDMFVVNETGKLLMDSSNVAMTGHGDPFFSSGLCDDRVSDRKEQTRRALDRPLQRNSNAAPLNADCLLGLDNQPMMSSSDFVGNSGDGPAFRGGRESSLFQSLHGGHPVQTITIVPDCAASQGRTVLSFFPQTPWTETRPQLPEPSPAASLVYLQNDVNYRTNRRGSTGSLQPVRGKKQVTFLCPQPAPSTSKLKQHQLAPAPAFCDNSIGKAPGGLIELSNGKAAPSTDHEQGKTILAQLLTQGKTASGPFQKVAGRANQSTSKSATHAATKEPQSTITSSNPLFFPIPTVSPSPPTKTHRAPAVQCQAAQPPTFSDFHKSLLSAAVSQALGVEKQDAHEVTASFFNSMLSGMMNSAASAIPTNVPSVATNTGVADSLYCVYSRSQNESIESANDEEPQLPGNQRESRRVHHLSAEQKRRSNIKYGFETLNQMVPELSVMSSGKINKATTLQRAADCCQRLKLERQTKVGEIKALRRQIDELQTEISCCQAKLPATGVPVVRPHTNVSRVLFQDYVRNRTLANWKFWIFSFLIRPLFDAYDESVVMSSSEAFCQSVLTWLQQHCSLIALRPGVLKALRELSTTTSILVDPSSMPQEATEAVSRSRNSSGQSSFAH